MKAINTGEKSLINLNQPVELENTNEIQEKQINISKKNSGAISNFDNYLPQFLIEDLYKLNDDADSKVTGDYEIHEARETEDALDFSEFEMCFDELKNENSLSHEIISKIEPKLFTESAQNKNLIRTAARKKFHSHKEVSSYKTGLNLNENSIPNKTCDNMGGNYNYSNNNGNYNNRDCINNKNNHIYNTINPSGLNMPNNFHYNNHSNNFHFQGGNESNQFYNNQQQGINRVNANNHNLKPVRSYSNGYVNFNNNNEFIHLNNNNCNYNIDQNRTCNPIVNQNSFYYNNNNSNNINNSYPFNHNNRLAFVENNLDLLQGQLSINNNNFSSIHNGLGNIHLQDTIKNNFHGIYPKSNEYVNNMSGISNYNTMGSLNSLNTVNNMGGMNSPNNFINLNNHNGRNQSQNFNSNNINQMYNQSGIKDYFRNCERPNFASNINNSCNNFNLDDSEMKDKINDLSASAGTGLKRYESHEYLQINNQRKDFEVENIIRNSYKSISTKVEPKSKISTRSLFSNSENSKNNNSRPATPQNKLNSLNSKKLKSSLFNNNSEIDETTKSFNDFFNNLNSDLHLFITTQKGSRTMQKFLDKISPDNLETILQKLKSHFAHIMTDIYGNYFCQRLIQCCSSDQRIFILENIQRNFTDIAMNASGTHSLQSLIEIINIQKEGEIIIESIKDNVTKLSLDANATHVIQKLISCINEANRETINEEILGNFNKFVGDSNGICVLKKFINKNTSLEIRKSCVEKISNNVLEIVQNPFGNYVVQFVLEDWGVEIALQSILTPIINNVVSLSMQKFSSNVVEKCLQSSEYVRKVIVKELFNNTKIASLIKNKYGNFVLQKAIVLLNEDAKLELKQDILKKIKVTSNKEKTRLNKLIEML